MRLLLCECECECVSLGLSSLAVEELQVMCAEMRSKFGQLSRTLVEGLEERDSWAGELDAKNRFVVALLKVQAMRMSQRTVKEEKKVSQCLYSISV